MDKKANLHQAVKKRISQVLFGLVLLALSLFLSAGTLDWGWAWGYLGVYVANLVLNTFLLLRADPQLVAERGQIKEGTKAWDRWLAPLVGMGMPVIINIVAGLDFRFAWTKEVPLWINLVGLVLTAGGYLLFSWAMRSNRFFSGVVRIQTDRGHQAETGGAYRFLRHPGYAGMLLYTLGTPLALGALWALVVAGITVLLIVIRTSLEDRTLQAELPGYVEFCGKTRYRLIPGVW